MLGNDCDKTENAPPKLYIRSAAHPSGDYSPLSTALNSRLDRVESDIDKLFTRRRCHSNLTKIQEHTLRWLRTNRDVIVWKADKNLGPCLIERKEYICRALKDHLLTPIYQHLSAADALALDARIEDKLDTIIQRIEKNVQLVRWKIPTSIQRPRQRERTFQLLLPARQDSQEAVDNTTDCIMQR